jgi:hypothetical protein
MKSEAVVKQKIAASQSPNHARSCQYLMGTVAQNSSLALGHTNVEGQNSTSTSKTSRL